MTSSQIPTDPTAESDAGPTPEKLLDHEYDGIREYDNPVPGWWHFLFWGSVVFSALYFFFFTFSPVSWTVQDSWMHAQAVANEKIFGEVGDLVPDDVLWLRGDDGLMAVGAGMFATHCAQCHARDGGGINGPNLTDDHYKNLRSIDGFYDVITNGAANGAMPAWENRLSQNERVLLSAYAASLRGTTPGAAKGIEGEALAPWPAITTRDAAESDAASTDDSGAADDSSAEPPANEPGTTDVH